MHSMQEKLNDLNDSVAKLKSYNEKIERLEKERSCVAKEMEYKILMLHNAVMNLAIFEKLK